MVYTVQMDLYIDNEEVYPDEVITEFIEEGMSINSVTVDHVKVIEVSD